MTQKDLVNTVVATLSECFDIVFVGDETIVARKDGEEITISITTTAIRRPITE